MKWLIVVLAVSLFPSAAISQNVEDCNNAREPAQQIAGCTEVINQIKDNQSLSIAYVNRGTALAQTHQLNQALSDLNKAVRHDPGSPLAYYNRGNIYFDMAKYGLAVSDFDKTIALDPNLALAYLNRGLSKKKLGRRAAGDADIRAALQRDSTLITDQKRGA
jgi:tetratricopeptide (TPR) repeat protein